MGQAPSTVETWDGSGARWFKIYQILPTIGSDGHYVWPTDSESPVLNTLRDLEVDLRSIGKNIFKFNLPKSIPNGEYLLRIGACSIPAFLLRPDPDTEHVGLHGAYTPGTHR
jgi:hypothetical protein